MDLRRRSQKSKVNVVMLQSAKQHKLKIRCSGRTRQTALCEQERRCPTDVACAATCVTRAGRILTFFAEIVIRRVVRAFFACAVKITLFFVLNEETHKRYSIQHVDAHDRINNMRKITANQYIRCKQQIVRVAENWFLRDNAPQNIRILYAQPNHHEFTVGRHRMRVCKRYPRIDEHHRELEAPWRRHNGHARNTRQRRLISVILRGRGLAIVSARRQHCLGGYTHICITIKYV